MNLNIIDIAILTILLIFTLRGVFRGLIGEVMGFIAIILALILAIRWMSFGSALLMSVLNVSPVLAMLISFILIFVLVFWGTLVVAKILQKILQITMLSWLDHLGGGAFGLLKGAVITSLLVLFVGFLPLNSTYRSYESDSLLFRPMQKFAPHLFDWVVSVAPSTKSFYDEVNQAVSSRTKPLSAPVRELLKSVQRNTEKDSLPIQRRK
ncbi:MAG: CvpA family protein [Calditrichaeota bacterium]|nr:CvpA family protein [Calditrichota bacterium]